MNWQMHYIRSKRTDEVWNRVFQKVVHRYQSYGVHSMDALQKEIIGWWEEVEATRNRYVGQANERHRKRWFFRDRDYHRSAVGYIKVRRAHQWGDEL